MIEQQKISDTGRIEQLLQHQEVLFLAAREHETIVMSRTGNQARAANDAAHRPEKFERESDIR